MSSYVTPRKNAAYIFYISLISQANTKIFQANPTLATGDFQIAIDDGVPANLATLPVVDADYTKRVKIALSADEMNGDNLTVICSDAAGAEWCDLTVNIQTTTRQVDDLAYPATSGRSFDVDASGRLLMQPAQPNVVIPTVTDLTNAPTDMALNSTVAKEATLNTVAGYIDTEITAIINRIGAFTGSGVNTVLGFLKALASKTATTPSDIGGTFDPATDSLEAVEDNTPAGVWAYSARTLTSSGNAATTVSGSAVSVYRGTTWSIAFTSLGNITGYSKIWLTVKQKTTDADSQAIVQIEKTVGLTVLNGSSSVTAGDGAIAVSSESLGNLTVTLKPAISSQISPDKGINYDIKVLIGAVVTTLADGRGQFTILSDVTRSYS